MINLSLALSGLLHWKVQFQFHFGYGGYRVGGNQIGLNSSCEGFPGSVLGTRSELA